MEVTRLLRGCAAEIPDDFTEVFVGYPTVHREPLVPGRVSTAARLAEPVTDGRVTDLGRSFRALFDNGVNAARLRGGDLVVVENLDQGALWFLAEEAATGESLAGWRLVHLPPCRMPR